MHKKEELTRGLGFLALVASVFNCTVGGGIFRLPGSVYGIVGSASPLVYLVCFSVMLLVATVFIGVGKTISVSGGPYAYVQPILGNYLGFICGVLLWCLATFAMASVANAYAHFVAALLPIFSGSLGEACALGLTFIVLTLFNLRGVKSGASLSLALSIIKILPLILLIGIGLPHLETTHLALPTQIDTQAISRAAMILIFAFTGVECALIPSGEIKDPGKILSKALYSGLFLVLFLYLGVQLVSQSILGPELSAPDISPLALTAERLMGPGGSFILKIGAAFSTLGYLAAITLSLPRSLYAFSIDGYLPQFLSEVNPKTHAPSNAILLQVCIAWILAVSSQFEKLAVLANLSAILMYLLCAFAAILLLKKQKVQKWTRFIPALFAIFAMFFLLTSVTQTEWFSILALLALSTVGYLVKTSRQNK